MTTRWLDRLHALELDRFLYRIWRYNPVALVRLYQHHAFDRRYGVTTSGYGDLRYEPTPARVLERTIESLPAAVEDLTFVDIGSGKGKAVLIASTHPFRKVIGVELYEEFHALAVKNVADFPQNLRRCDDVELVLEDAASYAFPVEPAVLYFFNPFPVEILERVLANIEASLVAHPRTLYLLFYAPILLRGSPWDRRQIFDRSSHLKVVREERAFTLYASS